MLTKFHYCCLDQQKSNLQKEKAKAHCISSLNEKALSKKSRNKLPMADIANLSTLAVNLEQQLNNLKSRMSNLQETVNNKDVEKYPCLFSECSHTNTDGRNKNKGKHAHTHYKKQTRTKKRNERRKKSLIQTSSLKEWEQKFIKNLSKNVLTDAQIKLLSKGLEFAPTPKNSQAKTKLVTQRTSSSTLSNVLMT